MKVSEFFSKFNIFAKRQTIEPRDPYQRNIPYTGRTQAGIYVTPDRALLNDTFWACRRYISESCGQLPAKIIQQVGDQQKIVTNHQVDYLLNTRPNPELSPFQFRETLVGWAVTHGNGVAEIERDLVGRAINLWPIKPERIHFLRDAQTQELIYRVNNGTDGHADLSSMDVFHIRGFGDGAVGQSVAEYAAQTIGYARAAELFGSSYFGEGLHFGGTAIFDGKADIDTVERLREELDAAYRGPFRANKWFIGDGGLKINKTTADPDEAQFLETMQFLVESVCRWMGVPPHKVGHLLRMTFNNVEQLSIDAVGQCIVPWAIRLGEEATYKLFGGNRSNLQVVFEVKGLLRGDFKSRQEGLQIQRRNGIINGKDWAHLEDIPEPKSGGDLYIVEANMATLNTIANPPQKPESKPAPTQTPDTGTGSNDNVAALALLDTIPSLLGELV